MSTLTQSIEPEAMREPVDRPAARVGRCLRALQGALLRQVRVFAWRLLDLETEFEFLD